MADYLDALGGSAKPPSAGGVDYLAALDSVKPKNTKLQSDTQLSQLDQPTGTFNDQKPAPRLSFLNSFESPQEAYINEPARRVSRAKESAGTIGPQKLFPSGNIPLPTSSVPQFIKNLLPEPSIAIPDALNVAAGSVKGNASQLPVAPGRNVNDVLSSGGQLYEDVAHKPHLPLSELADQYISSGAPTTGRASLFGDQALRGVAGAVEPFTTTENLALAGAGVPGGPLVQKAASAYFADQALTGLENDIGDVAEGRKSPIEGIASGLVNFGIARGALGHALATEGAAPAQETKAGESPKLNFLRPPIENAPREGADLQNAAQAEQLTGQQQLDQKRAAAKQERMQQPAAMSYLDALDSVSPTKEPLFKAGDEVPQNATPEQLSAIDKAGFAIGQDGRLAEKPIPPPPRVGEEVPGLDQQAEALQPKRPIITPPPPEIRGLLPPGTENAPQGDMGLRGEEKANIPTEQPVALPGQGAQGIQPSQTEIHPKYEQIGIDADSGQPILKQKAERRLDTTERKRVSEMSPEEMQKELLTSESLNLPNKRAFLEEEARNPSPAISMSDADGLKAFNDKFGYEYGNKLLEAKAEALKEAGLDAYHEKGDEFLQRDGSPEDLHNKLEKARELLRNKVIEVELNDGTIKKYQGVDFSYGVGKDLSEAEANLKQHKAEREARGERARGELRGITEAGSQADQVPQGSQLEASPARAEASNAQDSVEPHPDAGTLFSKFRSYGKRDVAVTNVSHARSLEDRGLVTADYNNASGGAAIRLTEEGAKVADSYRPHAEPESLPEVSDERKARFLKDQGLTDAQARKLSAAKKAELQNKFGKWLDKEKAAEAKQRLNEKLGRSHSGVPVDAIPDLLEYGYYTFKAGARTFAEWSARMLKDFGEQVRPHLKKAWDDIQEKLANGEEIPKPKNLARGSAAVAEKPKPLSFLKNPEAQKSGGAPPKVPTFLKTESAPEGKENFAGNINLDKYSVTDAAKRIVKDAAVTHEGFTEQRRGVQSHEQTKALAASLGLTTEELSKTRKGSAFNAEEMHAAGNLLASSAETMRKLQDKAAKTGNVNDQIAVLEAYARHVAVQQAVSGATAEAGRALNALKIIRQAQDIAGKDNRTKVLDALREHLGEDWVNHAEAITKKVSQFPEGDTASLNKFLRETAKQPFAKYVNSFYIANLLSGTKTVLKKAGGDLALGLIQHPQRVAEGLIDASTHKILGRKQEHFVREALPAAQAYVYALPKAIQKFAYVMKNGFTPEQAGALEIPGIVELPGGLKNPLNHATRALSATAEMFKTMALEGELTAEATRQAIKEGATGQALDRRIRQLVTERPPELIERAAKQSKYETYTSDADGMVKAAQYIQSLFKIPEDFAIKPLRGFEPMRLVIPFAKVPWNIAKIGIEYGTPARALSFLSQEGRSAKNFAPNTAKALIGSSVFAIGYSLAQQGNLTGPIPKDQKEKEAFFGEGKQPYSVKIGDQWVSYHVIPPLAMGWAAAAALHDTKGDPAPDRILEIGSAVAKSLTDASFFRGLNNVMEAIQDPGSIGSKVKQLGAGMASGFVPLSSLLRQVSHAKDSTVRDADTIYDRVKANIPILEEELPAKIDRFGRPVTRRGDEGVKAFLPLQPADSQPLSRIDQEVDRLDVKVPDVGKTVSIKNKQFELNKDQQRELQKLSGNETFRVLGELLSKDQYKQLDDEKKSLIVERAIHAAREKARMEYIQKNFKTLTPKAEKPRFLLSQPAS